MATFIFYVVHWLIQFMIIALIAHAILSWLVAFEVVNLRNRAMYQIASMLEAVTRPILAPFRRFVPVLGGVDISPVIALIILMAADAALVPMILKLQPYIG